MTTVKTLHFPWFNDVKGKLAKQIDWLLRDDFAYLV